MNQIGQMKEIYINQSIHLSHHNINMMNKEIDYNYFIKYIFHFIVFLSTLS